MSLVAKEDWPSQAAEADKAIRSRDTTAMKRALDNIQVVHNRTQNREPAEQEAMRRTTTRLEKASVFRESISEKGLVLGLDGRICSVLFSPDDRWLAIGQSPGGAGALVLDSYTGEKCYTLWPGRGNAMIRVRALAFDRNSAVLAAAFADNSIKLARLADGKESSLDVGPGVKRVLAVALSPSSGDLVAGLEPFGEGKGKPYLKVWNFETGKEPFAFKTEHSARVEAVAFCPGGHQVATGSHDKRIVVWNAVTGRIWRELHTNISIRALACSPHGRTIVASGLDQENTVFQFWDYAADRLLATKPSPHGPCHCVAFSRNGDLLASGSGSRVLLWNPENHTLLAT